MSDPQSVLMNLAPGRECGGCTLCCKVMDVPELEKPRDTNCTSCKVGIGCGIYASKPASCSSFRCLWLQGVGDDSMRPDRSGVILTVTTENDAVIAHVDKHKADAWRRGKMGKMLISLMHRGVKIIVACGPARKLLQMGVS